MSIKYIDLFAGVGGFRYGIESIRPIQQELSKRPDSDNNTENELVKWKCVYSNEWDKYANSVYKKHYERCDDRDIRTVKTSEIPDHDLLVGGFPCQAFSVAGKRRGFEDTRGTLFFEIARIAKQKQPRLLLLENVKGLLSHDTGNTFKTIIRSLDELGYDCQWQVLNSKDFGVPQNRERVFIIGHLRGTSRPEVFPIRGEYQKNNSGVKVVYNTGHDGNSVYSVDGIAKTQKALGGGQGGKGGLYAIPVLTPKRLEKRQNGRRFKTNGEPSFTLTGQDIHGIMIRDGRDNRSCLRSGRTPELGVKGMSIRRLTPVECERLQGFPDNWTKYGYDDKEMSDAQRYKMMGNAVTTNVVTAIIRKLI